jgi:hypothetical protein
MALFPNSFYFICNQLGFFIFLYTDVENDKMLQEVQLGEELLATGDIQNGVEHLSLAVAVCGQPHSLLSVLQQTLPPQIYQLLLQNLEVQAGTLIL